jgi:hypothetical protein
MLAAPMLARRDGRVPAGELVDAALVPRHLRTFSACPQVGIRSVAHDHDESHSQEETS